MAEIRVANRTPKPGDIIGTDKSSGTVADVKNGLVLFDDGFCCSLSVLADCRYLDALPTPGQCAARLRNTVTCPLCKQLKAPDLDTLTGDTLEPFRLDPYCRGCVDEALSEEILGELKRESERSTQNAADVAGRSFLFGRYTPMLLAERDTLLRRVGVLEAGLMQEIRGQCQRCDWSEPVKRDSLGDWAHPNERGEMTSSDLCNAGNLWNILKPKTDPDPTDKPLSGNGGDVDGETVGGGAV